MLLPQLTCGHHEHSFKHFQLKGRSPATRKQFVVELIFPELLLDWVLHVACKALHLLAVSLATLPQLLTEHHDQQTSHTYYVCSMIEPIHQPQESLFGHAQTFQPMLGVLRGLLHLHCAACCALSSYSMLTWRLLVVLHCWDTPPVDTALSHGCLLLCLLLLAAWLEAADQHLPASNESADQQAVVHLTDMSR